ncbi:glyoxylase-like metal-dependent hydrolase (beta-lactamase superfamily II) [Alkalibacillus filiformis]|uniref:Glyoxylase-like metal-dependent hydrolase (Beta-lactamase superfamily II) n=1 Tax=Alkalibacillus filiformis TaxID=200990 RepID=A0ABU0DR59_9BACI|nr:MBL fold metallo-hydrolase [Alkalibacillus filiformis]MDQ0350922.1 glyoxylase-like metal-dependent hydrolase (beta-lactamase superfamily II) [Alkalibacillus filiformis]
MTHQTIHQITVPTPYAVGDVHCYIYMGEKVTLFDAGVNTEEAWEAFQQQLKEIGLEPSDIKQIVLTHHHPDHTGLIEYFDQVEAIYGHPITDLWLKEDREYFQHYFAFFDELYNRFDVPHQYRKIDKTVESAFKFQGNGRLTQTILEGNVIPNLPSISVIETPGHAQSHLSFFDRNSGSLIAGDHLLKHISSNPILEAPLVGEKERPKSLINYRKAMKKLKDYKIGEVLPGHGEPFQFNEKLIDHRIKRQEERAEHVFDYLKKHDATPFEVCQYLFPKHYEKQFGLTMSETIGQLDYLEYEGKINSYLDEGVLKYSPCKTFSY